MLRIPPQTYAFRRRRLLDLLPEHGALLLPTHREAVRSNTTHFPFRPQSDFYYLTGFPEPDAWALFKRDGEQPGFHLFVLPRDAKKETWTGRRYGEEGAKATFGADHAWPLSKLKEQLETLLEDVDTLYFAFGRHGGREAVLHKVLGKLRKSRKPTLGPATLVDPQTLLADMRLVKDKQELAVMREGGRITGEAHVAAMQAVKPGAYEYEIQALVEYTFRRQGAWGWAYPSIIAAGANACILHYVRNDAQFRDGDLMLIDAGAEIDGYATDVTRTTPVGTQYTGAQREVYALVLEVQQAAVASVKPGNSIEVIHEQILDQLISGMLDLGILRDKSVDQIIEDSDYEAYYPHRSSHWLGVDVHDVGRYTQRNGDPKPLVPGMIFTVEPGLYLPPDDNKLPEAFRGIGVRIEDDVLVTTDGYENLTSHIPKQIDEVEALRRDASERPA